MKHIHITPKELRKEQLRCIALASRFEAGRCPALSRFAMVVGCLALAAFVGWATIARVGVVTHAAGTIVPDSARHMVRHLEGGTVQHIAVHEGQLVPQGATLVVLENEQVTSALIQLQVQRDMLTLQQARLAAFIGNQPFDTTPFAGMDKAMVAGQKQLYVAMVQTQARARRNLLKQATQKQAGMAALQDQLATAKERVRILQDVYDRRQKLVGQGQMAPSSLHDMQQKLTRATADATTLALQISQTQGEVDTLKNNLAAQADTARNKATQALDHTRAALEQNARQLAQAQALANSLTVRAPITGTVKGLAVHKPGESVKPGEPMMEIIPQNQVLFAEVHIPLAEAGYVQVGNKVRVKPAVYRLTHNGTLPGVLVRVSDKAGALYATALVRLVAENAGKAPGAARDDTLAAGMAVTADIVTGRQTLLGRMLHPIQAF